MTRRFLLTLLFALGNAYATTYWVATTGNNSNSGTSSGSPWLTIEHAAPIVVAGDTVIVRDGTYGAGGNCASTAFNAVDITVAGTAIAPITWKAEHYHQAILDSALACGYYIKVHIGANWNIIDGFVIQNEATGGIQAQGNNDTYIRNEIRNIGNQVNNSTTIQSVGILTYSLATNTLIDSNYFHDNGRTNLGCTLIATPTATYTIGSTLVVSSATGLLVGQSFTDGGSTIPVMSKITNIAGTTITIVPAPTAPGTGATVTARTVCTARDQNMYLEGANVTAVNNIAILNTTGAGGFGMSIKVGTGYLVANNTFYGPVPNGENGQLVIGDDLHGNFGGFTIRNNIFSGPSGLGGVVTCGIVLTGTNSLDHNIANGASVTGVFGGEICSGSTGSIPQSNNSVATPGFVNPGTDFHITSASPAYNAGITVSQVLLDYDGIVRPQGLAYDLGAFEVVSTGFTITSPTVSQTLTGYQGVSFTGHVGTVPSAYRFCWYVDAYPVLADGINPGSCVLAPYTLPINTFQWLNGTHAASGYLCDAITSSLNCNAGTAIAAATPVSFTIANTYPAASAPGMSVATSLTGTNLTITATVSGTVATQSKNTIFYVDGVQVFADNSDTSTTPNFVLDESGWPNGNHNIGVVSSLACSNPCIPPKSCAVYGTVSSDGTTICRITEWSGVVNFSNGALPYAVLSNAFEVPISTASPFNTFQLSPTLYNTDGTTTASSFVYKSESTSVATVSSGGLITGVSTGNPTAGLAAAARIDIMAPTVTGTDLQCNPQFECGNGDYQSAAHPFTAKQTGQLITIGSGSAGLTPGNYIIGSVNPSHQITLLNCVDNSCAGNVTGGTSGSTVSFSTGPTRVIFAEVSAAATPNPPVCHFNATGQPTCTYTPGDRYLISGFNSEWGLPVGLTSNPASSVGVDQPYSVNGCGYVCDYAKLGYTTLETSPQNPPSGGVNESTYAASLTAYVANYASQVSGYNINYLLDFSTWLKQGNGSWASGGSSGGGLFQVTSAVYTPTWSVQPLTYVLNSWLGVAYQGSGGDEFSNWGRNPFAVPIQFSTNLTKITSNGTSCTATGTFGINAAQTFIIDGSSITSMNSVNPAVYHPNSTTAPMTFACNVAAGTYGAGGTPDAGLTIEPFGGQWLNNTNGTTTSPNAFIPYTAWTIVRNQMTAASAGRLQMTFPQVGPASIGQVYNWGNPGNGLADYTVRYITGSNSPYLGAQDSIFGLLQPATSSLGIGNAIRNYYGSYTDGSYPLVVQNSSVATNFGFQGYTCTVTSFTGNTITCSAPHNLPNILPTTTRLTLTNTSNLADGVQSYTVTAATCAANSVTATVGTNAVNATQIISVAGVSPGGYNVNNVQATSGGGTTVVYPVPSCPAAYVSGGTLTVPSSGKYVVLATPTATTITVANAATNFTCNNALGGTATFSNGATPAMTSMSPSGFIGCSVHGGTDTGGCVPGNSMTFASTVNTALRGLTFTMSGQTSPACVSSFAGQTFIYPVENLQSPTSNNVTFRQIPNGSSSSGTATIVADNNFVPGRNWSNQDAQMPDLGFAGQAYCLILPCAGTRLYGFYSNQQGYDPLAGVVGINSNGNNGTYGDTTATNQLYLHPHWDDYYARYNTHAIGLQNLLEQRVAAYSLTARLPSPDVSQYFDCTARTGARGKMTACINLLNAPQTGIFPLTAYETGGQNVVQFIANSQAIQLSTIAAGTSTATVTVPQGGEVVFLFPVSFSAELNQPVVAVKQPISQEIANATKVLVRYGYDSYLLDAGNITQDCGTGTACLLNADRFIGPIYYRIIYLDTNGKVLATSDVQTL